MLDLRDGQYYVSLGYDMRSDGILVFITPKLDPGFTEYTLGRHFFYSLKTGGFFPMAFASVNFDPVRVLSYTMRGGTEQTALLLGCRDGYIRYLHNAYDQDDVNGESTDFSSYVFMGPFQGEGDDSFIAQQDAMIADESGAVKCEIMAADTAEGCLRGTARFTTNWTFDVTLARRGRQFSDYPRVRGKNIMYKLSNVDTDSWSFESILASVYRQGKGRVL
jgi:hypothetical protein